MIFIIKLIFYIIIKKHKKLNKTKIKNTYLKNMISIIIYKNYNF